MTPTAPGPTARLALVAAAGICATALVAAQQPAQAPQATFKSGVELVQIDVVVVDARGNHVRGLTARDFEISDRKTPQQIAAFEEVSHARESASAMTASPVRLDVATNHTVQADRLIVMVVDDLHIWTGRTDTAKAIARDVLTRLGAEATMAVLFTSGEGSTEPTMDRAVLLEAIDTMRARQSIRRPNPAIDQQRGGGIDPEASMEAALATVSKTQGASLQHFFDNITKYKTLQDAARMLGGGDARRKAFVLVSEGIAKDLSGVFDSSLTPCETQNPLAVCYHDSALRQMMDAMRRANVVTYSLDPRGKVTSQELALESFGNTGEGDDPIFRWNHPLRQAQDGLTILSEATGGFAVVDSDNFADGIGRIVEDLDHYYLVGFYPSDTRGRGYRPLHVSVPAHPEWTVRFRKGYKPGSAAETRASSNPLVALSAGVLPATGLRMRVTAVPLPRDRKNVPIALAIEVTAPRQPLTDADGRLRDDLSYEILVVDEKKKKVKSAGGLKARVTLSATAGADALPDDAIYQVPEKIELAPGTYQLRVSAQSATLNAGGSVYLNLTVPNPDKAPLTIGGIAIGYAKGARVAAATVTPPARRAPARAAARMPMPQETPLLPFAPTLDRAFAPADILLVYFEMAARDAGAPFAGRLEILDAGGRVRGAMPFTSDARGRVGLTLPLSSLSAGAYVLRVTSEVQGATASRELGFSVSTR